MIKNEINSSFILQCSVFFIGSHSRVAEIISVSGHGSPEVGQKYFITNNKSPELMDLFFIK